MAGDDAGSGDEVLAALVASLRAELAGSQAALARAAVELAQARERIAELEARLRQTPRNSSRPPSSEGLAKPPRRSLRKRSGRKPGGQDGHEGSTLAQVARPDRELRHEPACCGPRGAGLAGRPVTGVERRQVSGLSEVTVTVTGHQLIERECGCGHRTKAAAPQGAQAPVQYGPRIAAIIVYLYIGQFLSRQRTAQALAEMFGIPLSSGTVAGITARAAGRLGGFLEGVRDTIAASEVAGFDETGFRADGRLHWVHCGRTGKYTLLMVHPKRGRQAMEEMGILSSFAGVAVHDAWAPYDTYTGPEHQLCCAHALRELQAVTDAAPAGQWCRAAQAAEAITAMQTLVREAISQGRDAVDPAALAAQVRLFRSAALAGASQTSARSGALMKKHNALARRLRDRQDDYLSRAAGATGPQDRQRPGPLTGPAMTRPHPGHRCPRPVLPPGPGRPRSRTTPPGRPARHRPGARGRQQAYDSRKTGIQTLPCAASEGIKGSNQALNALAGMINAELAGGAALPARPGNAAA